MTSSARSYGRPYGSLPEECSSTSSSPTDVRILRSVGLRQLARTPVMARRVFLLVITARAIVSPVLPFSGSMLSVTRRRDLRLLLRRWYTGHQGILYVGTLALTVTLVDTELRNDAGTAAGRRRRTPRDAIRANFYFQRALRRTGQTVRPLQTLLGYNYFDARVQRGLLLFADGRCATDGAPRRLRAQIQLILRNSNFNRYRGYSLFALLFVLLPMLLFVLVFMLMFVLLLGLLFVFVFMLFLLLLFLALVMLRLLLLRRRRDR